MTLRTTFSENIRIYRKRLGLSQQQLAEMCEIVPNYVSEIEKAKKFPSVDMIERIAEALKIQPYMLFINSSESMASQEIQILTQKRDSEFQKEFSDMIDSLFIKYGFKS